jgi:hypothetical protein
VDELVRVGQAVLAEIGSLAEDSGNQFVSLAKRARTNRRMIFWVAVSVAVDIVLSAIIGVGWLQIHANDVRVTQLTDRLNTSQTTTRRDTLCPLYSLLLAGDTAAARAAATDKAAFDRSVVVIKNGYDALDCQQFAGSPPPTPSPTASRTP